MSLKGFKRPDGSIEKIHTDSSLSKANVPADASAVGAKDNALMARIDSADAFSAELNSRLSDLESGAPTIIAQRVTAWLSDNVDPVGSAVTVDSSLTIEGSAADAKTVGDALADLNDDITSLDANVSAEIDEVLEAVDQLALSDGAIYFLITLFKNALYKADMSEEVEQLGDALANVEGIVSAGGVLTIRYLLKDTATASNGFLSIT